MIWFFLKLFIFLIPFIDASKVGQKTAVPTLKQNIQSENGAIKDVVFHRKVVVLCFSLKWDRLPCQNRTKLYCVVKMKNVWTWQLCSAFLKVTAIFATYVELLWQDKYEMSFKIKTFVGLFKLSADLSHSEASK